MKPTVSKFVLTCSVCILILFMFINYPAHKTVHTFAEYSDRIRLHTGNRFTEGDFEKILNPHDYEIVYNRPNKCNRKNGVFLLVLIHSNPTNERLRIHQRQSCLNMTESMGKNIVSLFLMGRVEDKIKAKRVEMESNTFGDILMADFKDSYNNLTLKLIMGMKWASIFCPNAQYILKSDDDVFINLQSIVKMLLSAPSSNFMAGYVYNYATPFRNPSSKWYVTVKDYPYKFYPPFCRGYSYVMSGDLPVRLFNMSLYTPFFYIDDVYMGFLIKRLNISPVSKTGFRGPGSDSVSFCALNLSYAAHLGVKSRNILEYWREQQSNPSQYSCNNLVYYLTSFF